MKVQLLHNIRPVLLYGLGTDTEVIGDFLVLISFPDQFQNLFFPLGEALERGFLSYPFPAFQVPLQHQPGYFRTEVLLIRDSLLSNTCSNLYIMP